MYPLLSRFLPASIATVVTALAYTCLLVAIFIFWNSGQGEFRYLHV